MKFPVRIEDFRFLVAADCELICDLRSATLAEQRLIVAAINLLPVARNLIAEAMDNHIYNEADGETPSADCQYVAFLKDADAVLKGIENA